MNPILVLYNTALSVQILYQILKRRLKSWKIEYHFKWNQQNLNRGLNLSRGSNSLNLASGRSLSLSNQYLINKDNVAFICLKRVKGYCWDSNIATVVWRVPWNYLYFHFKHEASNFKTDSTLKFLQHVYF